MNELTEWDEEPWPAYAPDEILPGLFQGGTEDDDVVMVGAPQRLRGSYPFDVVVTLYADANPAPWGVEEIRFGFYDSRLLTADATRVLRLARDVHRRWVRGDRVLIRCQAGVNRSGLVTSLVLMLEGYRAADAIALLRRQRSPWVLNNADFERWLLTAAPSLIHQSTDPQAA